MLPFPMWKLGATDSSLVRARALENRARDGYPFHAAEMTAYMHPEQGDTSLDCLRKGLCLSIVDFLNSSQKRVSRWEATRRGLA